MRKASRREMARVAGVISPLLSNLYLTEVDRMLECAKEVTRSGQYTAVEYARFADDLVILLDAHPRHAWLLTAVNKRLREELASLQVEVNEEKSRIVDLAKGESFDFRGFTIRRLRSKRGGWWPQRTPQLKKRTALLRKLKEVFRSSQSHPIHRVVGVIQSRAARLGQLLRPRQRESVLLLRPRLGGTEGAAAPDAGTESSGPRVDEVASAVALWNAGVVSRLPRSLLSVIAESAPHPIGPITLGVKRSGKRGAGNPPAPVDVAGAGDGLTATPKRARRWKRRTQPRGSLRSTASVLDPTTAPPPDTFDASPATAGSRARN